MNGSWLQVMVWAFFVGAGFTFGALAATLVIGLVKAALRAISK